MDEGGRDLLRVDRLGPAGGGCLNVVAALLVMAGFLLPWASCAGNSANGLELTTAGLRGDLPNQAAALVGLAPLLALGLLGVGLALLPLAAREKMRAGLFSLRAVGSALLGALALAGLALAGAFFLGVRQAQRLNDDLLGLGGLVAIENGFWVTALGFVLALAGAALAFVTSFVKVGLRKK